MKIASNTTITAIAIPIFPKRFSPPREAPAGTVMFAAVGRGEWEGCPNDVLSFLGEAGCPTVKLLLWLKEVEEEQEHEAEPEPVDQESQEHEEEAAAGGGGLVVRKRETEGEEGCPVGM
jgi:hypothetical protein